MWGAADLFVAAAAATATATNDVRDVVKTGMGVPRSKSF